MKLTILSDIHEDIDKYYSKYYNEEPHDFSRLKEQEFVIIAGDISGNPINTKKWVKENISHGLFIEGNHLGYEKSGQYQVDYKQGAQRWLKEQFNDSPVKFLENNIYIEEDIVFIGCTLYTDFNLYNRDKNPKKQKMYMNIIQQGMNDFKCVKCEHNGNIQLVTPEKYLEWHLESIVYIENICQKFPDKKIIIISHHAPSIKSIASKYQHGIESRYNSGYASNLEELIKKYPNIKLWIHGHVHSDNNYKIAQCKIISHPFGYYNENNRIMNKFGKRKDCLGYVIDTEKL